VESQKKF
jgi:hypothetical protein